MSMARETERSTLSLCLLAQSLSALSWVKFGKANTFPQNILLQITCHFLNNTKAQVIEDFPMTWLEVPWVWWRLWHKAGSNLVVEGWRINLCMLAEQNFKLSMQKGTWRTRGWHSKHWKIWLWERALSLKEQREVTRHFLWEDSDCTCQPSHPNECCWGGRMELRMCQFFSVWWLSAHCNYRMRKTAVLWIKLASIQHRLKK